MRQNLHSKVTQFPIHLHDSLDGLFASRYALPKPVKDFWS